MSVSPELLIYSSKLRRADYPEGWGGTPELEAAVGQVVHDRLRLAQDFLGAAERSLSTATADVDCRNVISRAYYACHHAIRACVLHRDSGDVEGHTEAIAAFTKVVSAEPELRNRLAGSDLIAFMHKRHLADYYPYTASYPREQPLALAHEAQPAVAEADMHLRAICDFIRQRGGAAP